MSDKRNWWSAFILYNTLLFCSFHYMDFLIPDWNRTHSKISSSPTRYLSFPLRLLTIPISPCFLFEQRQWISRQAYYSAVTIASFFYEKTNENIFVGYARPFVSVNGTIVSEWNIIKLIRGTNLLAIFNGLLI